MLVPPGRSAPVTAPVAGRVDAADGVRLASGLGVRRQQVVLRLTPLSAPPRDLRVTYEADQAAAKARFDAAQAQLDRAKQMLKDQVGSQRGLEQAQQEFLQAKASYDAARERLERTGTRPLDADVSVPISPPFDGTVGQLLVAPGQVVPAGATLFELENLTTLWVRVPVYVGDLGAFRGEGGALVESLGAQGRAERRPARRVTGPPAANALASSADLFFEVANGDRAFRPGERVSVILSSAGEATGLTVPASAVAYDYHGGAWIYVRTAPGTYVRQRVEVARTIGTNVVLARGAEPWCAGGHRGSGRVVRHRIRRGEVGHAPPRCHRPPPARRRRRPRGAAAHRRDPHRLADAARRLPGVLAAAGRDPDRGPGPVDAGGREPRHGADRERPERRAAI